MRRALLVLLRTAAVPAADKHASRVRDRAGETPARQPAGRRRSMTFLLALLFAGVMLAAEPRTIAVLPMSSDPSSPIESAIAGQLAKRGWNVVDAQAVEALLEQERIRYLDSLAPEHLAAFRERTGAEAVVVGSLLAWRDGTNPMIGIAARMLDAEGNVLWGDVVALSGLDSETVLGLGRRTTAESLAAEAASRLVRSMPAPGESRMPGLRSSILGRPVSYRSAAHPRGERRRVCILPFASSVPAASRIAVEILAVRLEATGELDVVEPAELRAAMRAAGRRSVATMTSPDLLELSKHLGTTLFLRGNVHTWRDATGGKAEIQFDMTLADVATGQIVWAVTHVRRGADYAGLFQRGVVHNVVSLADRALSEALSEHRRSRGSRR